LFDIFFAHKKVEKPPQKVAYTSGSWEVFFLCSPDCPKQPRTSFPFYKLFYPTISGRISDQDETNNPWNEKVSNNATL
jgi:hypothetical protein